LPFDQVSPKPILDFKQMCLGLTQIYPNGKMENISNVDLNDLLELYIKMFFILSHQMAHLTKFDQSQSIGFYKHTL